MKTGTSGYWDRYYCQKCLNLEYRESRNQTWMPDRLFNFLQNLK